jgi:hypothetical protein
MEFVFVTFVSFCKNSYGEMHRKATKGKKRQKTKSNGIPNLNSLPFE